MRELIDFKEIASLRKHSASKVVGSLVKLCPMCSKRQKKELIKLSESFQQQFFSLAVYNFYFFMQIEVAIFNFISCGPLLSSWCQNEPTLISGELVATSVVCRRQRCIDAQLVSVQSFLKILAERRNEQFWSIRSTVAKWDSENLIWCRFGGTFSTAVVVKETDSTGEGGVEFL